jgi:hypothetical protein
MHCKKCKKKRFLSVSQLDSIAKGLCDVCRTISSDKWQKANPDKMRAQRQARYAVKIGKIFRPSECSQCHIEEALDGHHPDYSKPLEVQWLCRVCHRRRHSKNFIPATAALGDPMRWTDF